jgi:deazaflavin-dependent oxidoreductase (nitroreductase family)
MAFIRPFTVAVVNPVARHLAPHLPFFCIATYRGRTSGRLYRTPLNVFRRDSRVVFALTYGEEVQWVRNVRAAGECEIRTRGRDLRLENPALSATRRRGRFRRSSGRSSASCESIGSCGWT